MTTDLTEVTVSNPGYVMVSVMVKDICGTVSSELTFKYGKPCTNVLSNLKLFRKRARRVPQGQRNTFQGKRLN